MKTHIYKSILLVISLFCYTFTGHTYNLRQIINKDGLSNSSILSLGQDENHLMLFGTCDGLNIFDGKDVQIFRSTPSQQTITGNFIEKIVTTQPGTYWIRTNSGLNKMDYQKGEVLFFPEYAGHNFIFKDCQNSLFVYDGSENLQIFNEKTKLFQPVLIHKSEPIPLSDILDIKFDSKNRLWIYTKSGMYYCFFLYNKKNDQPYIELHTIKHLKKRIRKAFPDGNFEFVVDQDDILYIINSEYPQIENIADISWLTRQKGDISSIIKYKNDLFISFQTEGTVKLIPTPSEKMPYTIIDLQIHCGVLSMVKDKSQNIIWIGTDGQGVYKYTEEEYTLNSYLFPQISPKVQKPVRAIFKDHLNNLWIGTRGDGIVLLPSFPSSAESPIYYSSGNSQLNENSVYAFAPSKKNLLWIGNDGGLNYYSYTKKQIQKVILPPGIESINYIHSIHEMNDSILWVTTGGTGILKIILDTQQTNPTIKTIKKYIYKEENLIYNYFFTSLLNADLLLFGNRGYGVFSIPEKQDILSNIYFNDTPKEQAANDVFCMEQDKDGNLWLGTSMGLIEYTKDNQIKINKELNEFINSIVHAIQADNDDNLWLSTNKGIIRYNPGNQTFQLYGQEEGIDVIEYCDGASFVEQQNGTLYFGGINGFVTIHKEKQKTQESTFPIIISSLNVLGKNVMLADFLSKEKDKNRLSLNYRQHSFTLKISVPDYIYSSSILLYYRIKETDENWTGILSNTLNFTNMSPGEYTLEVKYINQATNNESNIFPIHIHITPPWYASIWAYIAYFLIGAICILLIIYSILRRNRLNKAQELKELEQVHQKEVYESKLEFFTNVAYEFSTPLTLIFGPCNRIINNSLDKNTVKYAKVIQRNAEILNDLTQEIVTFRSIESKERKPYIELLPVGEIISKDLITFVDQAYSNEIVFEKEIDSKLVWNSDHFFLRTIIINLLSNAFQHTTQSGTVSIQTKIQENVLLIIITFSGKITEKEIQVITSKHHLLENIKDTHNAIFLRNELGLTMSHNMINLLQGELQVNTTEESSQFIIKFPCLEPNPQKMKVVDIDPIHSAHLKMKDSPEIKDITLEFNIVRQTLFLIEQDKDMLWFLIDTFHEEFNIIPIQDYTQTMQELKTFQPDLIIYDIAGNVVNSIEFTEQLKSNKDYAHIPIILLSGERNIEEQIKGINAGAEMYIFKPFYSDYLKISVSKILNRKETLKSYFNSPKSAYDLSNAKLVHKEDKKFIEEILNIINNNLDNNDLSAAFIANRLHISMRHLYRKLSGIGEVRSISNMIKDCRLQVAKDLLINTKLSIDEIAYKSGFTARSTFFRCFTEKFHITPKEFRKQQE